jgi:hypothetical protein
MDATEDELTVFEANFNLSNFLNKFLRLEGYWGKMDTTEDELAAIKAQHFKGVAKIDLKALDFTHPLVQDRYSESPEMQAQDILRLKTIFDTEKCKRSDEGNFIDAIVDGEQLAEALHSARLTETSFRQALSVPQLKLSRVKCLNGLHRTRAAEQHLDQIDRWWTVRLYSQGSHVLLLTTCR